MGRGTTDCIHAQRKGRPPADWWWCGQRRGMISPQIDCEVCTGYAAPTAPHPPVPQTRALPPLHSVERGETAEQRETVGGEVHEANQKGAVAMTTAGAEEQAHGENVRRSKGILWDLMAGLTVEGETTEQTLWEWAREQIAEGPKGTLSRVAEQIGCSTNTLKQTIRRREEKGKKATADGTSPPAREDEPKLALGAPPLHPMERGEAPTAVGAGGEVRETVVELAKLDVDVASLVAYLEARGLMQEARGFVLGYQMGQQERA